MIMEWIYPSTIREDVRFEVKPGQERRRAPGRGSMTFHPSGLSGRHTPYRVHGLLHRGAPSSSVFVGRFLPRAKPRAAVAEKNERESASGIKKKKKGMKQGERGREILPLPPLCLVKNSSRVSPMSRAHRGKKIDDKSRTISRRRRCGQVQKGWRAFRHPDAINRTPRTSCNEKILDF